MRSLPILLSAALALTITATAQSPDPVDILRRADSACGLVRTAKYGVTMYKGASKKPEYTVKADVAFRQMKERGDIGIGAVRIELMHVSNALNNMGMIYAYDGTTLHRLSPSSKEFLVAEPEQYGFMMITENWLGQLIQTPLNGDGSLAGAIAEVNQFHYDGIEVIEGLSCYVVSVDLPVNEYFSQRRTVWYIGTEDYLPRKRAGSIIYNGVRQEDGMTLHELNVNSALPDSLFVLSVPDGYRVTNYEKFPKLLAVGTAAPEWTLFDASSRSVSLSELRGNVVLLDFWYTTCGPCLKAMPKIQKLYERFKDRGVVVYGINTPPEDSANAIRMMQKKGYTYGLLLNGGEVGSSYIVFGWPTFYLIGDDGTILFRSEGLSVDNEEKLTETIENYLHERGR